MKPRRMHVIPLCAVLGILDACSTIRLASSPAALTEPPMTQTMPQMRASDRMFYWQEEARELHAMATHREFEAELILKKKPGSATSEFVKQMRLLAHQLHEAAEYADTQAKEAERAIPPDVIQRLHSAVR